MAKRILVADDEIRVVAVIKKRLESVGYDVITAYEGYEALKKARAERPDLIVLDLIMPNLNGYQVCAMLKRDDEYKHIPILMLTARSQEKDIEEGMRSGADYYMTKPFEHEMLLAQISALLAKAEPAAEAPGPAKAETALKKEERPAAAGPGDRAKKQP
jgi:DNA-binding response OmpR family regulator